MSEDEGRTPPGQVAESGAPPVPPRPVHVRADGTPIESTAPDPAATQAMRVQPGAAPAVPAPPPAPGPGPATPSAFAPPAAAAAPAPSGGTPVTATSPAAPSTQLISTTPASSPPQTARVTPAGPVEVGSTGAAEPKRRRWPLYLGIGLAGVVVLGVIGAILIPGIFREISRGEQIAFQEESDEFTEVLNDWQSEIAQLDFADFDTAKSVSDPYVARMEEALGQMKAKAASLDGSHKAAADAMIEAGGTVVEDVKAVVAAMTKGRQDEITAAAEALDKSIDAYNETVVKWNDLNA
ncbi:MAG: hypothetical protein IT198_00555 [Acidimicrobiia bacterium]|nr:hypothetical protein [Acidimicrobiia bacterium]